ncbi:MAG: hypothetical protein KAV87_31800 [Desulfobacteraceae bacterium]|nr:hypothetical protein [Desulfobacteraceae bacterium]
MIQLLDAMMVMIGCYIITRMWVLLLRDDIQMGKSGKVFAKVLAAGTIGVALLCILFALLSFVGTLDLEQYNFQ